MIIKNLDECAVIKWRLTDACNFKCPYCIRKPLVMEKGMDDDTHCLDALPEISRIIGELSSKTNKKVKVDLIGGEVTILLSLSKIVDKLVSLPEVEKVNITTNFERDVPTGPKISLTASYHPTQTKMSIKEWFEKANEVKDKLRYFKVETVATKEATHIDEFIEMAKAYGIQYQVEEDLFNEELIGASCSSTKEHMRYEVTDDEGNVRYFPTRNMFLKQHGIDGSKIYSGNKLCSRDWDYVYVEVDRVFLCAKEPMPLSEYHVVEGMHPCWRGPNAFCTLCGNITVRTIPEFVFTSTGSCNPCS